MPYESFPYSGSHPDNLATIARIFGIQSPDIRTARILELGCGAGGNLIPIAAAFPDCRCTGIDLSIRQVDIGNEFAASLGLGNVQIIQADLADYDFGPESYDYVICHGVFSWVSPEVQRRILTICRDSLSESGIAYISFNTYPGWHLRQSIREMMNYHAGGFSTTDDRISQSRALLQFLIDSTPDDGTAFHTLLRDELKVLSVSSDSYLFHEHLEDHNQPLYFHEFATMARDFDLRFLGEADFSTMVGGSLDPAVSNTLSGIATDIIQMEQYQDFIRNRMFRSSLLCHQELCPNRHVCDESTRELRVAMPLTVVDQQDGVSTHRFLSQSGAEISITSDVQAAAIAHGIDFWPQSVGVRELCEYCFRAEKPSAAGESAIEFEISGMLLTLYSKGLVELHTVEWPLGTIVQEMPEVFSVARLQAHDTSRVTSLRHQSVHLDDLQRFAMPLFDGTRTIAAVTDRLIQLCREGQLKASHKDGSQVSGEIELKSAIDSKLHEALFLWCQKGLLMP